jgi:hypothetical protein
VVPAEQQPPRRPLRNVSAQTPPPSKGVGGERVAELQQACVRATEPVQALELPECRSALMAFRTAIAFALTAQARAAAEFETAKAAGDKQASAMAAKFAEREEVLDPLNAGDAADRTRRVEARKQGILKDTYGDWSKRYEAAVSQRLQKVASEVIATGKAAEQAVERAELRATLDTATPDTALVAQVLRTVESEPTLKRPAKARALVETAIRLDDAALLLALESLLPMLQDVIEGHLPKLTRHVGNFQAGEPSDAMANAVWCVTTLRKLRDQRLQQTSVGRARELFEALRFLALKSVGTDASDPYCVASLNGLSAERMSAIASSKLDVFGGKSGARWATRYVNRAAPMPKLTWPPSLAPLPMTNMQKTPKGGG